MVEINKTRHETGESLPSILKKLGKTIDLQIYSHPYEKEIRNCGVSKKQVLPEKPLEELKYMPLDESPLTMVNTVLRKKVKILYKHHYLMANFIFERE